MGPHLATLDAGGATKLEHLSPTAGRSGGAQDNTQQCEDSVGETLAVLALAIIAGCTTVALRVGMPAVPPDPGEDAIEPAWCQASAVKRSFAASVIIRRLVKPVGSSERVVSRTQTKDRGRYLPTWVAYDGALASYF